MSTTMTHHTTILATSVLFAVLVACGGAETGHPNDHERTTAKTSAASASAEKAPAQDPHAGHAMPGDAQPGADMADPHAGHVMPSAADASATGQVYDLVLSTDPQPPVAKATTHLVLDPRSGDARVQQLAIVHEKPLHLIVVSRDLSFFAHEHPQRQSDGTYALDFAFPASGEHVLFGDFAPEGAAGQIIRMPVTVAGDSPPAKALVPEDRGTPKRFGDLTVALAPASIAAGADTMLAFTIERGGKPESGLRPYLGAMGHCVVIDETATKFIHSHPQELGATGLANVVQFHTEFPGPGKYKVWGQFDVGGKMLIADFALEVTGDAAAAGAPADPHAAHPH